MVDASLAISGGFMVCLCALCAHWIWVCRGFAPAVAIEEGLRREFEWMAQQLERGAAPAARGFAA